jgi:hypothetical protein
MLSLTRYLTRPLCGLDRAQRLRGYDDASGEGKDGEEQLEGDVGGEGGRGKGCGVFVGGVDAARRG